MTANRAPAPPEPPAVAARPPGAPLAAGAVIDGRYRVVRLIGQGGNGLVHEVEHVRTGRRLALKSIVDETTHARLEQEARATSMMRNPHVVRITDMGPADPRSKVAPYLVMELLDGQSLRALLDDAGQLPLELTVNIGLQVCECLTEAHQRNIVHRDLKPDNLFLVKSAWPGQYDVFVLDFGVVKIAGDSAIPKGSLTRTGSTVGTPYYMSLEQLRNSSAVDARADVYSLGVVLYECLSGRKPFVADTIGDLVYALCSTTPTPLQRIRPDLPQEVCDLIMRALRMNREERPRDMMEMASRLVAHGHPAFGLWLGASASPLASAPLLALGGVPKATSVVPMPPTPDEDEVSTVANAKALPALLAALPPPKAVVPAPPTPDEDEGTTVANARPVRQILDELLPPKPFSTLGAPVASGASAPNAVSTFGAPVASGASAPNPFSTLGAPVASGASAPNPFSTLGAPVASGASAPNAAPAPVQAASPGDRGTPTEMFRAAIHDPAEAPKIADTRPLRPEPPLFAGDRDTPTRALPQPSLPDIEAAARANAGASIRTGDALDGPTFRIDPLALEGLPQAPRHPSSVTLNLATNPLTAPDGSPHHGPVPPAPTEIRPYGTPDPLAAVPQGASLEKQGIQRSLDRALFAVGAFVERILARLRNEPPAVRYAVLGTAAFVILTLMLLLVIAIVR